jgi:hypothetical protein
MADREIRDWLWFEHTSETTQRIGLSNLYKAWRMAGMPEKAPNDWEEYKGLEVGAQLKEGRPNAEGKKFMEVHYYIEADKVTGAPAKSSGSATSGTHTRTTAASKVASADDEPPF